MAIDGMVLGDALEGIGQVGVRVDVIELCHLYQGSPDGSMFATAIGPCEEDVLVVQGDWPNGTFDGVGSDLDPAIIDDRVKPCQRLRP